MENGRKNKGKPGTKLLYKRLSLIDPCAGYNLLTYTVTWVLYLVANSLFSFYLASQLYFIPINSDSILKHFHLQVSMSPHSTCLPFTYT